jgi:hypothetical protein
MDKSLLEPCLRTPDTNEFEVAVAGYLDQQAALRWWHRNVARSQYGLQGWRRHRVYPDFVFALTHTDGAQRMVLLETKGLQLAGSIDTDYKQCTARPFVDGVQGRAAVPCGRPATGGCVTHPTESATWFSRVTGAGRNRTPLFRLTRNPGQPEFLQAVTEVMGKPVALHRAHPRYAEQGLLDRLVEPERVMMFRVSWVDDHGTCRSTAATASSTAGHRPLQGRLRFTRR